MHIDLIEEQSKTERLLSGFAQAMGNEGIELFDPYQARRDYDKFLNAPPDAPVDTEKLELYEALGIKQK